LYLGQKSVKMNLPRPIPIELSKSRSHRGRRPQFPS